MARIPFLLGALAVYLSPLIWREPALVGAQQDVTGYWRGSGWSRRVSDLKYVTLATDYKAEFSFTVTGTGEVHGTALVTYALLFNDSNLRTLITAANKSGATLMSLAPGIGGLLSSQMSHADLAGMDMVYDEPMPIRFGKIKGRLAGEKLQLDWESPPPDIPYKRYVVYTRRKQLQAESKHPAYSPWLSPAQITLPRRGNLWVGQLG